MAFFTQNFHDRHHDTRRQEFAREETMRGLNRDNVLRANQQSDERVEAKRTARIMAEMQQERQLEAQLEAEHRQREELQRAQEQEERLAMELQRIQIETQRDERYRQQLRHTDPELRELERKLNAGYLNKERQAQITNRHRETATVRQMELATARQEQDELERAQAQEQELERQRWEEARKYQADLELQLEDEEQRKLESYQEFLKEKLMIDEIVQRIYEEDRQVAMHELEKKQHTARDMADFMDQREAWKRYEAEAMEKENEQIMRYAQEKQQAERQRMQAQLQGAEAKEAVRQALAAELGREREEAEEMERIRQELAEEELQNRERQREKRDMEHRLRQRLTLQHAAEEDLAAKQARLAKEAAEEEAFRLAMLEKFALDDRLEQMNAQKRRMKKQEHKRSVENLIQERRARKDFEAQQEQAMEHQEQHRQEARRRMVEQERQRLLDEHASKLLGYLPKNVFRDSSEAQQLGSDFAETYSRRQYPDEMY